MNLEELVPAPNAEKVNKLAKRTFGYALDLDNISEAKAKALYKNLSDQMSIYETKLGSKAQARTKYYEMRLALEALHKHIEERKMEEDDFEEGNEFIGARLAAIKAGKKEFEVDGKKYKVTGDTSQEKKQKTNEDRLGFSDLEKFGSEIASKIDIIARRNGSADMSPGDADRLRYRIAKAMGLVETEVTERRALAGGRGKRRNNPSSNTSGGGQAAGKARRMAPTLGVPAKQNTMGESLVTEGAIEGSELIMAAKSMVDKYDAMIQDIGEMLNEELTPLVDKIRDEMGTDVAETYLSTMTNALNNTMNIMKEDRMLADDASRILTGEVPPAPMGEPAPMEEPMDLPADEMPMEPIEDEFTAAPAAQGGEEAPVGREKRT